MSEKYLVESKEREREAILRIMQPPGCSQPLFGSLELDSEFSWYLLQTNKRRLVESEEGDVDILAGRLGWKNQKDFEALLREEATVHANYHPSWWFYFAAFRLAKERGIEWPPSTSHLVALEVKCAYLDPEADCIIPDAIKSTKAGKSKTRQLHGQLRSLLRMGFDRVALLDLIANPPASSSDESPWLSALWTEVESRKAMQRVLEGRLPPQRPIGHWIWSIGAVIGGVESMRGAGGPELLRTAAPNPLLPRDVIVAQNREVLEEKLRGIMSNLPNPLRFPAVFIDCLHCRTIHIYKAGEVCNSDK